MKTVLVTLHKIVFYQPNKGYALLLKEVGGERQLPIIVGAFEAQSIALAVENIATPRPLTHDLFIEFLRAFSAQIEEVIVSDLIDTTFYAKIYLALQEGHRIVIDGRPSDAIALALRMKAPIKVAEKVMREAGQIFTEKRRETIEKDDSVPELQNLDRLFELQTQLQNAIEEENYELAARLRDQISALQRDSNAN